jgi:hypothetical protein
LYAKYVFAEEWLSARGLRSDNKSARRLRTLRMIKLRGSLDLKTVLKIVRLPQLIFK